MLAKQLSMALSVYRVERDLDNGDKYTFWDGSASLLFNPDPGFAIGAVYRNIARHGKIVPEFLHLNDRLEVGTHIIFMPQFRMRFDVARAMESNPKNLFEYHLGLESMLQGFLVFRAGYEDDQLSDTRLYSLGWGFNGPRLKVDYAFRQNIRDSSAALHSVDFRVPF
jgi:hypothetical protein